MQFEPGKVGTGLFGIGLDDADVDDSGPDAGQAINVLLFVTEPAGLVEKIFAAGNEATFAFTVRQLHTCRKSFMTFRY